jgi:hypothetical protein
LCDGNGNGEFSYVTYKECKSNIEHMKSDLITIKESGIANREIINKILKILQGNGEGGLLWKVNMLTLKNQWIDKCVTAIISVFLTLLTLYCKGALHL